MQNEQCQCKFTRLMLQLLYFYTTLHDLMLVNFGLSGLKCDIFSIIQALI